MKSLLRMKYWIVAVCFLLGSFSYAAANIHHELSIELSPGLHQIIATDDIHFLTATKSVRFRLHKNLQVKVPTTGANVETLPTAPSTAFKEYRISFQNLVREVSIQYQGAINNPIVNDTSDGLISTEGASLFGSSYWLPDFSESVTYEIVKSKLPALWKLASPKIQTSPQQEVYLVAAPFYEFTSAVNASGILLHVYLRKNDPALANSFLSMLPETLKNYSSLYGAYPYKEFSVIENFWETGFGMPGFTLLGPSVIRLPQILNSSLPHEVLHNWWGNGVYVDYAEGNWSEGLTNYLADHALQDQQPGQGRTYRLQTLMNFQDYTKSGKDFPLRKFTERNGFSSQAIGYGKAMMFFHMIRQKIGDRNFTTALSRFFQAHKFQQASYADLQQAFEQAGGVSLQAFFSQMLDGTGAPTVQLVSAEREQEGPGFKVKFVLVQQASFPYQLTIPVNWTFADGSSEKQTIELFGMNRTFESHFRKQPVKLEVDPDFDVFRWLAVSERPLSLSSVFGANKVGVASASGHMAQQELISAWQTKMAAGSLFPWEGSIEMPPAGTEAVVLLGDSPNYENWMSSLLTGQPFKVSSTNVGFFGKDFAKKEFSTLVMARSPKNGVLYVWLRSPVGIASVARRLLHYGPFGVIALDAKAAALKSTWPVTDSSMSRNF